MNRIYGKPKENPGEPYVAELYCGMCNQVPINTIWEGAILAGTAIGELFPIPIHKVNLKGEREVHELMICWGCVGKIEKKLREELIRRMNAFRKPPEDPEEGGLPHSPTPV